jgi:hypothetical protein
MIKEVELEEKHRGEGQVKLEDMQENNKPVKETPVWLHNVERIDLLGNYSEQTGAVFG